jgi:serine/threonine protein phosphatase PrpC
VASSPSLTPAADEAADVTTSPTSPAPVLASAGVITLSWLGDSRAYWPAEGGSRRLTADDSLA